MKAWIISLVLFILLLGLIIGNAVYIHRVAARLCEISDSLVFDEEETEARFEMLEAYWERNRAFIALSISYRELDRVAEMMISLRSAYETKNASDFEEYRRLFRDVADEISRFERFSVENLY